MKITQRIILMLFFVQDIYLSWISVGPKKYIYSPISLFIDIKKAHRRDMFNIYKLRCCYNLLWIMFYFDLYLMHKCIHVIMYNLSVPPSNGSSGKRLITPINKWLIFKNLNSTFFSANSCALRTAMTKKKKRCF